MISSHEKKHEQIKTYPQKRQMSIVESFNENHRAQSEIRTLNKILLLLLIRVIMVA